MSREIKFRGKTIPNHSTGLFWVYGNLLEWAGLFNIWEKDDDSDQRNYLVYPESVGQYTGLKDKNGKEIYEGDILQFSDKLEWYKSDFRWIFNKLERKERIDSILNDHIEFPYERREIKIPECYEWILSDEIQIYWEVIGDIYENPELMEKISL